MPRVSLPIFLALALLAGPALAPALGADRKKRSAEREKVKDLNELSQRLNRLTSRSQDLFEEQRFLHARVSELLDRAREAPAGSYLFDRLESAMDDFLDASEELREIREPGEDEAKEDRQRGAQQRTARELEKAYFRVKQGDYFGRQSKDAHAKEYVRLAGRLYQQGRLAYDSGKYWRARRFAEAAREVIDGLESLAQAAVRVPEPPKL